MKLLLLVLAICVTVAFSASPLEIGDATSGAYNPSLTDEIVYAQTYVNDDSMHGWAWGQIADDFVLTTDAAVDTVLIWSCTVNYAMEPIPPADYCDYVFLQDTGDNDPNSAIIVWTGTSTVTYIDTGDAFSGGTLPIYEMTCDLESTVNLTAGVTYWFAVTQYYEDDYRFYSCVNYAPVVIGNESWLNDGDEYPVWETGSSMFEGHEADMYFELHGTLLALDNSTWGNIKSEF